MTTESGKKIQKAINAVCRMQAAVSKILVEFDKQVPFTHTSVFGNFATKDLRYHIKASFWMPEGVYRYLASTDDAGLVEGICVCFVESKLEEPILLLGRLEYSKDPAEVRNVCDGWDLWYLYFDWNTGWVFESPKVCNIGPSAAGRIKSAIITALPLYSLNSMQQVSELMGAIRSEGSRAA